MKIRVTGSHRRYFVNDLSPKPDDDWVLEKLGENRFRSIDQASNEMESFGWVVLGSSTTTTFEAEDIWCQTSLCLGIRIDRKKLPAQALKVRLLERLDAERAANDGNPVPKNRRKELKEELESELLKKVVPSTALLQMVWEVEAGEILFSSTSAAANRALMTLFVRTFGKPPVAADPSTMAERADLPATHRRRLTGIAPTFLVGGGYG